jgi:hypothetical protein
VKDPRMPNELIKLGLKISAVVLLIVGGLMSTVPSCVGDAVFAQQPESQEATSEDYSTMHDYFDRNSSSYTPRFGLDPTGQAIARDRQNHLDQEARIRRLERQVAQLQRIVFSDPTIQAPVYRDTVPSVIGSAPSDK